MGLAPQVMVAEDRPPLDAVMVGVAGTPVHQGRGEGVDKQRMSRSANLAVLKLVLLLLGTASG